MSSKLEIFLWIISILLPHLLLIVLSLISSKFKKWWIKWLVKNFLNKKERDEIVNIDKKETKQIQFGVDESIKLENIKNSTVILGSDILRKERKTQREEYCKSKVSEKSINSITEEEVQSVTSKLTHEEQKLLKQFLEKLKKSQRKTK